MLLEVLPWGSIVLKVSEKAHIENCDGGKRPSSHAGGKLKKTLLVIPIS
jgi:hypothetical protein